MALPTGPADIEKVPRYSFPVNVHVKYVFGNAHSLDTSMKNVVYSLTCQMYAPGW